MDFHGLSWIWMDLYGFVWIWMEIYGNQRKSMKMQQEELGRVEWSGLNGMERAVLLPCFFLSFSFPWVLLSSALSSQAAYKLVAD